MQNEEAKLAIRSATAADTALLAGVEATCFPAAEAAGLEHFQARLAHFPRHFPIGELGGVAVGFISGMVIDDKLIEAVMFEKTQMHNPEGA